LAAKRGEKKTDNSENETKLGIVKTSTKV